MAAVAPVDESTETSEEEEDEVGERSLSGCPIWILRVRGFYQQVAALAPEEVNPEVTDSSSDTASVHSKASHDDEDEDDDDGDSDDVSKITKHCGSYNLLLNVL